MLIQYLKDNGVDATYTIQDASYPTGHAIIQVDPSGQNCTSSTAARRDDFRAGDRRILANFEAGDVLLMQNEVSTSRMPSKRRRKRAC